MSVINVSQSPYSATGNGTTDDHAALQDAIDDAYSGHGTSNVHLNSAIYVPAGRYLISEPLVIPSVRGANIFGDGRFTTRIFRTTAGPVFLTNGCEYSRFERMHWQTPHTVGGTAYAVFDLTWDNTGPCTTQSNTFEDLFIEGGHYGLRIGIGGFMGSETAIIHCFFAHASIAGLEVSNWNALQQTIIGGNFQNCEVGIHVDQGSVPVIHGVGFQVSGTADIVIGNQARDTYSIAGCRSESLNFARLLQGTHGVISACSHLNATAGLFVENDGGMVVDACCSLNGRVKINGDARVAIRNCKLERTDWLTASSPTSETCLDIENSLLGGEHIRRRRIAIDTETDYISSEIVGGGFADLP